MEKLFDKLFKSDLIKFVFVGGCSTGIDFMIYMFLSIQFSMAISKGISMICASAFSYFVNKNFTFEVKEKTNVVYLVKFYMVFVANFGSNLMSNYFVYGWLKSKIVAFICATLVGMTVNYLGQKFVVFKK